LCDLSHKCDGQGVVVVKVEGAVVTDSRGTTVGEGEVDCRVEGEGVPGAVA